MTGYPNDQSNPAGAIPVWPVAMAGGGASFVNITTNTSTLIKTGAGTLFGVSVNTAGTGSASIAVYDGTSASGTLIGTYSTTAQGGPVLPTVGISFATGLFAVTTATNPADVTVSYA